MQLFLKIIFSMASRYTASDMLETLFDYDFGLSNGELSDEEGEDVCAYLGGPSLNHTEVKDTE